MMLLPISLSLLLGLGQVRPERPASPPDFRAAATAPAVDLSDEQIERLVGQLQDPNFNTRNTATTQLCQLPTEALDRLAGIYRGQSQYEVKQRLRYIMEHIFYRKEMTGEEGFLGIQCNSAQEIDVAKGEMVDGIRVIKVIEGHAAAMSGLKDGDLIVEFEGTAVSKMLPVNNNQRRQPLVPGLDGRVQAFTAEVKRRRPGSNLALKVLRPAEVFQDLTGLVAAEPARTLQGALFRLQPDSTLAVASVNGNTPAHALGLRPNDMILEFNNAPLVTQQGERTLDEMFKRMRPGQEFRLKIARRQSRAMTINVKLGSRPVSLMNQEDMLAAQAKFTNWWRQQGGEVVQPRPERRSPFQLHMDNAAAATGVETTIVP